MKKFTTEYNTIKLQLRLPWNTTLLCQPKEGLGAAALLPSPDKHLYEMGNVEGNLGSRPAPLS